jgi:acetyl-CoA carboxylase carboxyl transferase subunit beta
VSPEPKPKFERRRDMPGLWMQCPDCEKMVTKSSVREMLSVCPECDYHFEISSAERTQILVDPGSFHELFKELEPEDFLEFVGRRPYRERLKQAQELTGLRDACVVGTARIGDAPVVFGVSDARFLRGSMGSVVGEKICRAVALATSEHLPFVFVSGSGGGARMDEGILSLMQMAKTSAALARFDRAGGFFISILTNPTMGGAMASFAALGDVVIAEPKALIGFAGPTVVRETIKTELPEGFQTAEFFLERGFVDMVVSRPELRPTLITLLSFAA